MSQEFAQKTTKVQTVIFEENQQSTSPNPADHTVEVRGTQPTVDTQDEPHSNSAQTDVGESQEGLINLPEMVVSFSFNNIINNDVINDLIQCGFAMSREELDKLLDDIDQDQEDTFSELVREGTYERKLNDIYDRSLKGQIVAPNSFSIIDHATSKYRDVIKGFIISYDPRTSTNTAYITIVHTIKIDNLEHETNNKNTKIKTEKRRNMEVRISSHNVRSIKDRRIVISTGVNMNTNSIYYKSTYKIRSHASNVSLANYLNYTGRGEVVRPVVFYISSNYLYPRKVSKHVATILNKLILNELGQHRYYHIDVPRYQQLTYNEKEEVIQKILESHFSALSKEVGDKEPVVVLSRHLHNRTNDDFRNQLFVRTATLLIKRNPSQKASYAVVAYSSRYETDIDAFRNEFGDEALQGMVSFFTHNTIVFDELISKLLAGPHTIFARKVAEEIANNYCGEPTKHMIKVSSKTEIAVFKATGMVFSELFYNAITNNMELLTSDDPVADVMRHITEDYNINDKSEDLEPINIEKYLSNGTQNNKGRIGEIVNIGAANNVDEAHITESQIEETLKNEHPLKISSKVIQSSIDVARLMGLEYMYIPNYQRTFTIYSDSLLGEANGVITMSGIKYHSLMSQSTHVQKMSTINSFIGLKGEKDVVINVTGKTKTRPFTLSALQYQKLCEEWYKLVDQNNNYGHDHSLDIVYGGVNQTIDTAQLRQNKASMVYKAIFNHIIDEMDKLSYSTVLTVRQMYLDLFAGKDLDTTPLTLTVEIPVSADSVMPLVRFNISWMHTNMQVTSAMARTPNGKVIVATMYSRPSAFTCTMALNGLIGIPYTPPPLDGLEVAASMVYFTVMDRIKFKDVIPSKPEINSEQNMGMALSLLAPIAMNGIDLIPVDVDEKAIESINLSAQVVNISDLVNLDYAISRKPIDEQLRIAYEHILTDMNNIEYWSFVEYRALCDPIYYPFGLTGLMELISSQVSDGRPCLIQPPLAHLLYNCVLQNCSDNFVDRALSIVHTIVKAERNIKRVTRIRISDDNMQTITGGRISAVKTMARTYEIRAAKPFVFAAQVASLRRSKEVPFHFDQIKREFNKLSDIDGPIMVNVESIRKALHRTTISDVPEEVEITFTGDEKEEEITLIMEKPQLNNPSHPTHNEYETCDVCQSATTSGTTDSTPLEQEETSTDKSLFEKIKLFIRWVVNKVKRGYYHCKRKTMKLWGYIKRQRKEGNVKAESNHTPTSFNPYQHIIKGISVVINRIKLLARVSWKITTLPVWCSFTFIDSVVVLLPNNKITGFINKVITNKYAPWFCKIMCAIIIASYIIRKTLENFHDITNGRYTNKDGKLTEVNESGPVQTGFKTRTLYVGFTAGTVFFFVRKFWGPIKKLINQLVKTIVQIAKPETIIKINHGIKIINTRTGLSLKEIQLPLSYKIKQWIIKALPITVSMIKKTLCSSIFIIGLIVVFYGFKKIYIATRHDITPTGQQLINNEEVVETTADVLISICDAIFSIRNTPQQKRREIRNKIQDTCEDIKNRTQQHPVMSSVVLVTLTASMLYVILRFAVSIIMCSGISTCLFIAWKILPIEADSNTDHSDKKMSEDGHIGSANNIETEERKQANNSGTDNKVIQTEPTPSAMKLSLLSLHQRFVKWYYGFNKFIIRQIRNISICINGYNGTDMHLIHTRYDDGNNKHIIVVNNGFPFATLLFPKPIFKPNVINYTQYGRTIGHYSVISTPQSDVIITAKHVKTGRFNIDDDIEASGEVPEYNKKPRYAFIPVKHNSGTIKYIPVLPLYSKGGVHYLGCEYISVCGLSGAAVVDEEGDYIGTIQHSHSGSLTTVLCAKHPKADEKPSNFSIQFTFGNEDKWNSVNNYYSLTGMLLSNKCRNKASWKVTWFTTYCLLKYKEMNLEYSNTKQMINQFRDSLNHQISVSPKKRDEHEHEGKNDVLINQDNLDMQNLSKESIACNKCNEANRLLSAILLEQLSEKNAEESSPKPTSFSQTGENFQYMDEAEEMRAMINDYESKGNMYNEVRNNYDAAIMLEMAYASLNRNNQYRKENQQRIKNEINKILDPPNQKEEQKKEGVKTKKKKNNSKNGAKTTENKKEPEGKIETPSMWHSKFKGILKEVKVKINNISSWFTQNKHIRETLAIPRQIVVGVKLWLMKPIYNLNTIVQNNIQLHYAIYVTWQHITEHKHKCNKFPELKKKIIPDLMTLIAITSFSLYCIGLLNTPVVFNYIWGLLFKTKPEFFWVVYYSRVFLENSLMYIPIKYVESTIAGYVNTLVKDVPISVTSSNTTGLLVGMSSIGIKLQNKDLMGERMDKSGEKRTRLREMIDDRGNAHLIKETWIKINRFAPFILSSVEEIRSSNKNIIQEVQTRNLSILERANSMIEYHGTVPEPTAFLLGGMSGMLFPVIQFITTIETLLTYHFEKFVYSKIFWMMNQKAGRPNQTNIDPYSIYIGLGSITSIFAIFKVTKATYEYRQQKAVVASLNYSVSKMIEENRPLRLASGILTGILTFGVSSKLLPFILLTKYVPPVSAAVSAIAGIMSIMTTDNTKILNMAAMVVVPNLALKMLFAITVLLQHVTNPYALTLLNPVLSVVNFSLTTPIVEEYAQLDKASKEVSKLEKEYKKNTPRTTNKYYCVLKSATKETNYPAGSYLIARELWTTRKFNTIANTYRFAVQGSSMQEKYLPTQYELIGKVQDTVFDTFLKWGKSYAKTVAALTHGKIRYLREGEISKIYNYNSTLGYHIATTILNKKDVINLLIKEKDNILINWLEQPDIYEQGWEMYIKNEIIPKDKTRLLLGQTVLAKIRDLALHEPINEMIYKNTPHGMIYVGSNMARDHGQVLFQFKRTYKYTYSLDMKRFDGHQLARLMYVQAVVVLLLVLYTWDEKEKPIAITHALYRIKYLINKKITMRGGGIALMHGAQGSGDVMTTGGNSIRNMMYGHYLANKDLRDSLQQANDKKIDVAKQFSIITQGDDLIIGTNEKLGTRNIINKAKTIGQVIEEEGITEITQDSGKPSFLSHTFGIKTFIINKDTYRIIHTDRDDTSYLGKLIRSINEDDMTNKKHREMVAQKVISYLWLYHLKIKFWPILLVSLMCITNVDPMIKLRPDQDSWWMKQKLKNFNVMAVDLEKIFKTYYGEINFKETTVYDDDYDTEFIDEVDTLLSIVENYVTEDNKTNLEKLKELYLKYNTTHRVVLSEWQQLAQSIRSPEIMTQETDTSEDIIEIEDLNSPHDVSEPLVLCFSGVTEESNTFVVDIITKQATTGQLMTSCCNKTQRTLNPIWNETGLISCRNCRGFKVIKIKELQQM